VLIEMPTVVKNMTQDIVVNVTAKNRITTFSVLLMRPGCRRVRAGVEIGGEDFNSFGGLGANPSRGAS
jgi:hypothetical protein